MGWDTEEANKKKGKERDGNRIVPFDHPRKQESWSRPSILEQLSSPRLMLFPSVPSLRYHPYPGSSTAIPSSGSVTHYCVYTHHTVRLSQPHAHKSPLAVP